MFNRYRKGMFLEGEAENGAVVDLWDLLKVLFLADF